jgi:hypothetical protein
MQLCGVPYGVASGNDARSLLGPFESASMSDHNEPFAILRNAVVDCIEQTSFHNVVEAPQLAEHRFQIGSTTVKEAAHILKHPDIRLERIYGSNERGQSVTIILLATLVADYAKGLARGATDYHLCGDVLGLGCNSRGMTMTEQVCSV